MCERAVEREPLLFEFVLFQHKTQEICEKAAERIPFALEYVSDCYVRLQEMWHEKLGRESFPSSFEIKPHEITQVKSPPSNKKGKLLNHQITGTV